MSLNGFVNAQETKSIPERKITINFRNEKMDLALNRVAQAGKFSFSYNPAQINVTNTVNGSFTNQPVREILNEIFGTTVDFKQRGNYLILSKSKVATSPKKQDVWINFSGYVRDSSGNPVPFTSVYDKKSLESTISNEFGFYKIRFNREELPLKLFISRQGYLDTIIELKNSSPAFNNLVLKSIPVTVIPAVNEDSLAASAELIAGSFFKNFGESPSTKNISDTLFRKAQISFIPFAGTNGLLSGNVINDYSLNIIGGFSAGNNIAEVGGMFNVNRGDVKTAQVAGFANVVGGKVDGFQVAGFANVIRKDIRGFQAGGFTNISNGSFTGMQLSGFANIVNDSLKGFQVAGFLNSVLKNVDGCQVSGFCNIVIDTLRGCQVGFVNYARQVNGVQLGFFNYSKAINGVPIGFMSYVNTGYHKVEISADEIFPVNLAFRSGLNAFHNILTAGMNPGSGDDMLWTFGYGIGASFKLSEKLLLDIDATSSQVVEGNNFTKINLLNKGYLGLDIKIAKKMSIAFGGTINGHLYKTNYSGYPDIFTWIEPDIFDSSTYSSNLRLDLWYGAKVALRFF